MTIAELITEAQKNLAAVGLETNVAFKLLYAVDNRINNLLTFDQYKDEKIGLFKQLTFLTYLKDYMINEKPLPYITHETFFFNHDYVVLDHVHIPKVESETMIEEALKIIGDKKGLDVLDLCCGTGVLGISLAQEIPLNLTLSDTSKKALKNTKINCRKYHINGTIIKSNLFEKINDKFDVILCNPPYVAYDDKDIEVSVKKYEPHDALFAAENGLFFYQEIMKQINDYIKPNAVVLFEIGYQQAKEVVKIIKTNPQVKKVKVKQDAFQHDRIVIVYF